MQLADFFKDFEKKVYDSLLGCKCLGGVENSIGEGKCIGVAGDASGERKCVGVAGDVSGERKCVGVSSPAVENKACIGVGVSGGADSICLLVCLANLFKKCPSVSLKVVTVNHNIRSEEESGGDCDFVVSVCNKLNEVYYQNKNAISCEVVSLEKGKVFDFAKSRGAGIEESARFLRYQIFEDFIEKNHLDCFCLAHNKNDQLETALMRFLQGSSIEGSCGIWENRGKFVRPLINCDRKEIEKYLTEQGFEWRTDCTNLDNSYFRNRVRNELVPFLDENFAGWKNSVLGGIKKNRLDFEIIEENVKQVPYDFDNKKNVVSVLLSDFCNLKDGLKIRFLFECCNLIGKNNRMSFSFFEDVVLSLKKVCNKESFDSNSVWFEKHAEDFVIICKKDKLFVKKYAKKQTDLLFFDIIEEDGEYFFNGKTVVVEDGNLIFGETIIKNVCFPLCIRNVQIGDVVKCADGKMKKVMDVFSDWHVEEEDKGQILIVQELNSKGQNIICVLGKEFGYSDWIVK